MDWSNPNASLIREMIKIDKENTSVLKKILNSYHWITISEFGKKADHNAWLLVQHTDHDLEFQKEVLCRLEVLYPLHETNAKNFAYLYDRIAIKENRPQRYGTQGTIKNNTWTAYPIEDPSNLDARRNAVGLSPFQDYINQISRDT